MAAANTLISAATFLTGRRAQVARAAWLILTALLICAYVVGIPYTYNESLNISPETAAQMDQMGLPHSFPAVFLLIADSIMFGGMLMVGVLLYWRRGNDWMALFVGMMLMLTGIVYSQPTYNRVIPLELVAFLVALGEIFQLTFLLIFPNGKFVPRLAWILLIPVVIWRPLMWGLVYLPNYFSASLASAEMYGRIEQDPTDIGVFAGLMLIGIVSQVYRYRRLSTPTQRLQVKWLLVGMVTTLSIVASYVFVVNVFGQVTSSSNFLAFAFARTARQLALLALPATLAISVLRYRLWNIDLIINRGLVYGALTILYVVTVLIFQQVFSAVTGGANSPLVVALSTALIAGVFQPARARVQRFVDRRFYPSQWVTRDTKPKSQPSIIAARQNTGAFTGMQLGVYQVLEIAGRGGMGEVYKGWHTGLDRPVAIKILPEEYARNDEFRARFEREAKVVASLRHPNIVNVFDFGSTENMFYMVMEYIDGRELGQVLDGKMPPRDVVNFITPLASALDYAHERGLVHRDVKPSNVMLQKVTATGKTAMLYQPILMDFGIAKILNRNTGLTQDGTMGTLDYMSPEQIVASSEVDGRADIYALGVMTYQMLTGELPFKGTNAGQVLFGHLQAPVPDPRQLVPELPEVAALAVMKAMAKEADKRYQTGVEFAADLAAGIETVISV